jgi:hypothetical protein
MFRTLRTPGDAMTAHEYLVQVLKSQEMRAQDLALIHGARDALTTHLHRQLTPQPRIYYGGSYGKNSMIREAFDLDLVVYFPHTDPRPIADISGAVHQALVVGKYIVHPQTVALRVLSNGGFHVDVVPARAEDASFRFANLYKRSQPPTTLRTSLKVHIEAVRKTGIGPIVRLLKLWRLRQGIALKSFALELLVARALGSQQPGDFGNAVVTILQFIEKEIPTIRLVDPANAANVLEITPQERKSVADAAARSLGMTWKAVFE